MLRNIGVGNVRSLFDQGFHNVIAALLCRDNKSSFAVLVALVDICTVLDTALDYANALGLVQLIESMSNENAGNADAFGNTPLHQACYNEQGEVVKAMLAKGELTAICSGVTLSFEIRFTSASLSRSSFTISRYPFLLA